MNYVIKEGGNIKNFSIRPEHDESGELYFRVNKPKRAKDTQVDQFINSTLKWQNMIAGKLDSKKILAIDITESELRENSLQIVSELLEEYVDFYKVSYNRVSIRKAKTRWGSCSSKQNLNFNIKISLLPIELIEYIIVHEVCHLLHFNHSKKFWKQVSRQIPDYVAKRNALCEYIL